MCIACHRPPLFSDQNFHNIGTTQNEYDSIHGYGAFSKLDIPTLKRRKDIYFNERPVADSKHKVDLALYNFMFRSNNPEITQYMREQLCSINSCTDEQLLMASIARVKTPTLRNLGHSAPYLHNGSSIDLQRVLEAYKSNSKLNREGLLRNGAPQLKAMRLNSIDLEEIELFLNSLNENYE